VEELEAKNEELDAFSYSVAHDLRSPLRSLDGFSLALLEDYADKLDDGAREYLRFIRESAQQMSQLIDDLLALSRVTRSDFQREEVDLAEIARGIAQRLQKAAPERQAEFVIADRLVVDGDANLLAIVLDNLMGNAWKYSSRCPQVRIEVGTAMRGGRRIYFVRDNGAGFDMAYASKLFGVFQRLHSVREFEGTGIGLATVQRIVRRHGGHVWADGKVDRGATFYFALSGGPHPPTRDQAHV
ncbi:MAG: multi-sensor signal transduction histidine kinase, partial [Alphaproteobacteria bacterium]